MKLTIFGGITGFNKSEFIKKFAVKCLEKHGYSQDLENDDSRSFIHYLKFEDELLAETESVSISDFLAIPSFTEKINSIERTFLRIGKQIAENEEHVFLDIHLSYLCQSQFFTPIYAANLRELDPLSDAQITVVTLIDDVYNIWKNLKTREDEYPKTSLRLREILAWRSVEQLQAEAAVFHYTTENRQVKNYLFAVRHPFESIYNLLFTEEPICLYLSIPITNTRNHPNRIKDINRFRKTMYDFASETGVVIFDPVTIDELALQFAISDGENYVLNAENRWPLETDLLVDEPDWPIKIPHNEVEEAQEDIVNNIKPRDFKLIDNSIFTIVYRKNFGGSSRGVLEEIRYTNFRGKRVYVYDPIEDAENEIPHPFDQDEIGFRNREEFYDGIKKGIEFYRARLRK